MDFRTRNNYSQIAAVCGVVIGGLLMADQGSSEMRLGIIIASAIIWGCSLIASALYEKKE